MGAERCQRAASRDPRMEGEKITPEHETTKPELHNEFRACFIKKVLTK